MNKKLFFYVLFCFSIFLKVNAQNTITFDDQGYSNAQNLNNFTLTSSGVDFRFTSESSTSSPGFQYITNTNGTCLPNTVSYIQSNGQGIRKIRIVRNDGNEFALEGFTFMNDLGCNNSDEILVLEGFKDGFSIGSSTITPPAGSIAHIVDISSNIIFGDVDIVEITFSGVNANSAGLDNVIWNTPTLPPSITSVTIPNTTTKIGDVITVNITASEAGLTLNTGQVNGVDVTGFSDDGGGNYSATYTVVEGNTDRAAEDDIPVNFILSNGINSDPYTTAISQNADIIDANRPTISNVSFINADDLDFFTVGDTPTAVITASEAGLSINTVQINGGNITEFAIPPASRFYAVSYEVVEGHTDRAAEDDIPVNIILTDAAGNNSIAFTTISRNNDAIDANTPLGYSVMIDQDVINATNQSEVSFTITNAEIGAEYRYSFIKTDDDSAGVPLEVFDSGTITSTTQQFTGIDITRLDDSQITLTITLNDAAQNFGPRVEDVVFKDTTAPAFTSATAASVFSGTTGTVYTATATDATAITYSISGGDDMGSVSITATGEVTFNTTPDFDNPTDTGADNTYVVDILATDAAGNTTTQTVTITVVSNTFIWKGTDTNQWEDASNWQGGMVPTSTSNVIIPAPSSVARYPVTAGDITVNSIAIADGATFIPGGMVTGTVTYTKNINSTNWELVSSPVSGESVADVIADIGMNIAVSGSGNQGFSLYNNANASGNAWEFAPAATISGILNNGQGYAVKLNSTGTVNFTGTVNTSDVVVPVANGTIDNFTLLGNPFLANVNADDFLNDNGNTPASPLAEKSLWFWDGTAYQTVNEMTAEAIALGTGFFIETAASGNIIFSYEDQTNSEGQAAAADKTTTSTNKFELSIATAEKKTSTKLFYVADKTTGFDNGFDSKMFGGTTYDLAVFTELVTDNQGNKLAIQTLPDTLDAVVPVGIIAKAGDTIVFSVENLNLPEGIDVYLEDKVTGTFTNLSETTYETAITTDTNTTGQFYIHTTGAKTLSNEDIINNNISIYKSNASELTITGLHTNADVVIYSVLSKQVLSTNVAGNGANTISLPAVNTGVYIVKISSESGTITKKISLN